MDQRTYRELVASMDDLSEAQKANLLAVLSGDSGGAAALAVLEMAVGEDRRCPHCGQAGAVSRGMARGLKRYRCNACSKSFNALTGTPLSGLRHKQRWLDFGRALAEGDTVKQSAERCDVAVSTAFRWRHRFLAAVQSGAKTLKGIVEADETFILASRKGARKLDRKPRKRGGKAKKAGLSDEHVPVLVAADRSGATLSVVLPEVTSKAVWAAVKRRIEPDALLVADGATIYPPVAKVLQLSHEVLNQSAGERKRGDLHINTVNNRHSRLKHFLRQRKGIATKYLESYLKWFHLIVLHANPSARFCLNAAVGA